MKQKIIGSIFNNNLIYENGNYRTDEINGVIRLLTHLEADFERHKKEKASKNADLSIWAPPLGFEPRTL